MDLLFIIVCIVLVKTLLDTVRDLPPAAKAVCFRMKCEKCKERFRCWTD